ncbi:hypothetical protein VP01_8963g1, partial [Puccinia sorghi]
HLLTGVSTGTGGVSQTLIKSWLRKKFDQVLTRRDIEKETITSLLQVHNPHLNCEGNYTIPFLFSQWEYPVCVSLWQEGDHSKKRLAKFLQNKEVLNSYTFILKYVSPATFLELNEILTVIEEKEYLQKKLAAAIGRDYMELQGMRMSELGLLTFLWKANSDLYSQAVEVCEAEGATGF